MKYRLLSLFLILPILGCSSSPVRDNPDNFKTMTAGQAIGDATNLYWYTEKLDSPYSGADYVFSGEYGWYKTDYRWQSRVLREIVREGELLQPSSQEGIPYRIHLRFNNLGEAVYQQYRLDGKVLPMTTEQINRINTEAEYLQQVAKEQSRNGAELIQGYWDGKVFTSCSGTTYKKVEFNQTLPSFVINRLATLESYTAFVGSSITSRIIVRNLLMLEDESYKCIERPALIEEQ